MADETLAKVPELERQIEPIVVSEADPLPRDLLDVRAEVQSTPRLQNVFRRAFDEKWSADRLADLLTTELMMLRQDDSDPTVAARFLADEFTQIGPVGVQLISTATGRIAAIIREEDIYQPAPVPREGSSTMAQPLPRIRPDLESAVVMWFHDKGREENLLQALAARGHQTELLREMGDPRLLVATKKGRRHIVSSLAKIEPKLLLEAAGGRAGTFLQLFHITDDIEEAGREGYLHLKGEVSAKSIMGVQDPLTTNLHHNRAASLRAALVGGWIRHLARILSVKIRQLSETRGILDLTDDRSAIPSGFWIAPPDYVRPFHTRSPKIEVFPVEDSQLLRVVATTQKKLGYLRVPHNFEALSQDFFNRWEASAYLNFDMWVDVSLVQAFDGHGVEPFTQVL